MFKVLLVIACLFQFLYSQELSELTSKPKNWINTCNNAKCLLALNQCTSCSGQSDCKSCLINKDPLCVTCANDIFNTNYQFPLNGDYYLVCDPTDIFQYQVCQVYCRGKSKNRGECKPVQSFTACLCYDNFNENLYKTITGNSEIYAVASSSNYGEFAVGFSNGSVTVFSNYGDYKRHFIVSSGQRVWNLEYNSNGDIAATGDFGSRLYSNGGAQKYSFTSSTGYSNCFLKNGDIAFGAGSSIYIYPSNSINSRFTLNGHTRTVKTLLAHPNGDLVSGSDDRTIKIWSTVDGSLKRTLTGHTDYVNTIILLENGNIASGSDDRTIRIWNTIFGMNVKTIQTDHTNYIYSIALLPSGKIASASLDNTIKIYDKETGQLSRTLSNGHSGQVRALSVNSNRYLVSVSLDNTIKLWN